MTTIRLDVTHSNLGATRFPEIAFSSESTILAVKKKLFPKTGTEPQHQSLVLLGKDGVTKVADMADDALTLAGYGASTGFTIHIIDLNADSVSAGGALEDTSLVPKFVLSDEKYAARRAELANLRKSKRDEAAAHPEAPVAAPAPAADVAGGGVPAREEI